MPGFLTGWRDALISLGILLGAGLAGLIIHRLVFWIAYSIGSKTRTDVDNALIRHARRPGRLIITMLACLLALPALQFSAATITTLRQIIGLILIASVGWTIAELTFVVEDVLEARYEIKAEDKDNLQARQILTQVQVLRRIAVVVIAVVTLSVMLMTSPEVRSIGASILASAGLAGLVVGMAARPALSNVIAGIQIALAQPIRIDDVVVVEGEWGKIEEITTTYVVVQVWDLRRLVLPLAYFIEKPFENWTRQKADIMGTVLLYADYSVPVEDIRRRLQEELKASDLWDGRVWSLQVTNATEKTVELRALMSAADSGKLWDLRCLIRERLVGYLQDKYPASLPTFRAEVIQLSRSGSRAA
jgi:small-conductance mechanosensitive channel